MFGSLRTIGAPLVLFVFTSSCQVVSWTFNVPAQVAAGSVFAMDLDASVGGLGVAAVVYQLPAGFVIEGASARSQFSNSALFVHGGNRDNPTVLGAYVAEPGHSLVSFDGRDPSLVPPPVPFPVAQKVYVRAPSVAGVHQIKIALGSISPQGVYQPQIPTTTQFWSITGQNVRSVQVLPVPSQAPFEMVAVDLWPQSDLAARVSLADLDGDGRDDVIEHQKSGGFRVRLSTPAGWQDITGNLPTTSPSGEFVAGDFDSDGWGDLALASGQVYFGSGGANWSTGPVLSHSMTSPHVAVADVNADGRADVVIGNGGGLSVWRANSNRTFTPFGGGLPAGAGTTEGAMIVADLDGDQRAEIVMSSNSQVRMWRTDGLGNWFAVVGPPPNFWGPYVAIDVDQDGDPEVVSRSSPLALGYSDLAVKTVPVTALQFHSAVAADHDRDGREDLLVANNTGSTSGVCQLWRSSGPATFTLVQLPAYLGFRPLRQVHGVAGGDIDGDSFPDFATAFEGERLLLWRNTNTGASRYGSGCSGSGAVTPDLSVQGTIAPLQTPMLQLTGASANGLGFVWLGLDKRFLFGVPALPLDLAPFGGPGCHLLVEPIVFVAFLADAAGTVSTPLPLPAVPATSLLTLFAQGAVWAPAANSLGLLFSEGLALRVQ